MRIDEPRWWYDPTPSIAPRLLSPIAAAWGAVARRRYVNAARLRPALPTICIGNLTAGGTGKTPIAMMVARMLFDLGQRPAFLTRGYGGRASGPMWVSADSEAAEVGDEPLLLARVAPTLVARDRAAGASAIAGAPAGHSVIVMDDGLQNGTLAKDLTIAVVDGRRGFGNGRVIPAGPLRAPLGFQLGLVDAIIVNVAEGAAPDTDDLDHVLRDRFDGLVLRATTRPDGDTRWLADADVVAFSGIGAPDRFFGLVERLGGRIVARRAFPDHHAYSDRDADDLIATAARTGAALVTTEKDWVRLGSAGRCGALKRAARTLAIRVDLGADDRQHLRGLIEASLGRGAGHRL